MYKTILACELVWKINSFPLHNPALEHALLATEELKALAAQRIFEDVNRPGDM